MTPTSEIRAWLGWRAAKHLPVSDVAAAAGLDERVVQRFIERRDIERPARIATVTALHRVLRGDPEWTAKKHADRREEIEEARTS